MTNKYYFTACLKKDDNGGIVMNKRNRYFEAINDLIELHNDNNTFGNSISFIGIVKHKANENPLDRIRDLNENFTLDIYTKITKAMEQLKNKDISFVEIDEEYGDIVQIKKVKYDNNKTFELNAYYSSATYSLYEFKIYYVLKGAYEDCCTLPSYFGKEQEKDLREFLNMYVD